MISYSTNIFIHIQYEFSKYLINFKLLLIYSLYRITNSKIAIYDKI